MPDHLIALRAQLAERIRHGERVAGQVKGIVSKSRIAQHGTGGREGEDLRDPVTRQQVKELVHQGHDKAHPMEMDPAQIVVHDCPELHDMRRTLKHKDYLIKTAKETKAKENASWGETVGKKKCITHKPRCRKGGHADYLHERQHDEKHHLDGDVGHSQIH